MSAERAAVMDVETLYLEYRDRVSAYALHHLGSVQDAQDAVSQVFLNAHKNWSAYDPSRGAHGTWLYAITRNVVREMLRRARRSRTDADFAGWDAVPGAEPQPEDALLSAARAEELAAALERLPERERDILLMRFYSGLPSKEVAARMGLSDANVRYLQCRAVAKLRGLLEL
ncbi:MAG TPA: sigma-70 family RNA polymerase sigma factor [Feifaniaceae bacterium]|nr:sigma-70 family RNA polymerase sigma factor [Feifaniaceae bacterium]